jgi:hypothetical protein
MRSTSIKPKSTVSHRRPPSAAGNGPAGRASFRQRYDDLEARREKLVARLNGLDVAARKHPAYRRALHLLNETFRKERLAQRLTVLQAAAWLIDVLQKLSNTAGS